jgi:hypothetical protein
VSQMPSLPDTIISTMHASIVLGVTQETIRNWIRSYPSIGIRIGGRYFVYQSALAQIVDGTPLERINPPSSRLNNRRTDDERTPGQSEQRAEPAV